MLFPNEKYIQCNIERVTGVLGKHLLLILYS